MKSQTVRRSYVAARGKTWPSSSRPLAILFDSHTRYALRARTRIRVHPVGRSNELITILYTFVHYNVRVCYYAYQAYGNVRCVVCVCVCAREKRAQPETLFLTRRRGNYILPTFSSHISLYTVLIMYYAYRILSTQYYVVLNIITLYYYYTFRFQIASSTNIIIIIILPCPRRKARTTIIIVRYSQFTFYKINTMIILRHRCGRKTAAGCFSIAREVGGIRAFSEMCAAFCLHASGR